MLETNAGRQTVSANVVVGADGARSSVASRVGAPYTWTGAHAHALTMRYLHDEADGHFSWWFTSAGPTAGVFPTNSGSLMFVAEPASTAPTLGGARLAERMDQLLSSYFPKLSTRLEASSACPPMHHIGRPGFARRAGGPGWVLVGDAGVFTDPMSQHGIAGAMRDAAFVVDHIEHALEHGPDTQDWHDFEADRDRHAIPILTATDLSITPGIGIDAIQQSHRELSGLIHDENLEIRRRTSTLRTPNATGRNLEEQPCVS